MLLGLLSVLGSMILAVAGVNGARCWLEKKS